MSTAVGILAGAVGAVGLATGLGLLLAPARLATAARLKLEGPSAIFYARTTGIRNLVVGALFLWFAITLGAARAEAAPPLAALGVAWAIAQVWDALAFARLASRAAALGATLLATASLACALLAWAA
ncbi:MAG: hypothetical protein IVW57_03025 [Ktedonobacterales bacterium]|nr:hypothetical protein [Ktedonobacterales bacterium]